MLPSTQSRKKRGWRINIRAHTKVSKIIFLQWYSRRLRTRKNCAGHFQSMTLKNKWKGFVRTWSRYWAPSEWLQRANASDICNTAQTVGEYLGASASEVTERCIRIRIWNAAWPWVWNTWCSNCSRLTKDSQMSVNVCVQWHRVLVIPW